VNIGSVVDFLIENQRARTSRNLQKSRVRRCMRLAHRRTRSFEGILSLAREGAAEVRLLGATA